MLHVTCAAMALAGKRSKGALAAWLLAACATVVGRNAVGTAFTSQVGRGPVGRGLHWKSSGSRPQTQSRGALVARQASGAKELDTDAVLKYGASVGIQLSAIAAFLAALDAGAAAVGAPPDWAVFVLFFGMSLRSRIFSPLDNSRPRARAKRPRTSLTAGDLSTSRRGGGQSMLSAHSHHGLNWKGNLAQGTAATMVDSEFMSRHALLLSTCSPPEPRRVGHLPGSVGGCCLPSAPRPSEPDNQCTGARVSVRCFVLCVDALDRRGGRWIFLRTASI